ncbi:hypothetical protein BDB00DRAFT_334483 [Zychaea mexicana]|uniref:uncharacterized protein n=1 Tax=Zychaea mexicana TaxID=64656 RepID=UPI0022FEC657|nr:uncharacterized protein BDB00DRAFT_334483 [Zychaea mexicana]KAI9494117.1 hypothetical protein BDB00DRAFT_334483 [Zychaea mexicana]
MRNKLADMSLRKYTPLGLQGMISVEKGKIRRSVERKLGVGKQRPLDDDTSHKDLQEGQMLYKFIEKQNWKFIDDLKKQLAKQVVYNLCEETWKANESEERKEIEHLLQQAKADLSKQRTDTLRSEVHDISHQVEMLKTVIIVQEELKEAGRRTKALDARCVNIDTADTLEQQVQRQGREVKGLLQRAKRLRHDQLLVTNERKKARLSSLEKSIGELDQTVIQARTTVLAEMFPMRTMKVVDDICQVLDNHGEFIRRLVDPVAADRGEEIGKKHLDNINSTEDGITFPLQFSMERLTKNFVENALSEVSERLDALENKSGS